MKRAFLLIGIMLLAMLFAGCQEKSAEKAQGSAKTKAQKGIKEKADAKKAKPTKPAKPAKKTEKPAKARRRAARAAKKDDLPNSAVWPDPKSKRKKG